MKRNSTLINAAIISLSICLGQFTNSIAQDIGYQLSEDGKTFKTTNAGVNWTEIYGGTGYDMVSLSFVNEDVGYQIADDGRTFKTTNAGVNWTQVYSGTGFEMVAVSFINENIGYQIDVYGRTFKTSNGGTNWSEVSSGTIVYGMNDVSFISENIGYMSELNGDVYKTSDGGANWVLVGNPNYNIKSISFVSENVGYSMAQGAETFKTTNGGISWNQVSFGLPYSFPAMCFFDENIGYRITLIGHTYITSDGGVNWNQIYTSSGQNIMVDVSFVEGENSTADLVDIDGKDQITVYPNPTNGEINLVSQAVILKVDLLSSLGQIIKTYAVNSNSLTFEIETSPGVYFLKILTAEGGEFTTRIVKE